MQAPGGENYNIVLKPDARQPVLLQGWIQRAGHRGAVPPRRPRFRDGEAPGAHRRTSGRSTSARTFSADFRVEAVRVESHNVLGRIAGSKRPDETIWFASHWDAYGVGAPDARGRRVRPGALDSASGIAGVVELARAFRAGPRPERTLVFAAWTAEERGLLGAEYYATSPLFPMDKAVANLTLDTLQPNGLARDVVLIGKGQSELEDRLAAAAARAGPDGHSRRPAGARPVLPRRPFRLRQARRSGASADGARRRGRPGRGRPRGGRPLGHRVHRPIATTRPATNGAPTSTSAAPPRTSPCSTTSAASSPSGATGRTGTKARSSGRSGRKARRRGGRLLPLSRPYGRGGAQAEGLGGEGLADSEVQTLTSHRCAMGPSSPVKDGRGRKG